MSLASPYVIISVRFVPIKRHHRRKSEEESPTATHRPSSQSGPPPLRKRSSRSRESSRVEAESEESVQPRDKPRTMTAHAAEEGTPEDGADETEPVEEDVEDPQIRDLAGKLAVHMAILEEAEEEEKDDTASRAGVLPEPLSTVMEDAQGESESEQRKVELAELSETKTPEAGHDNEPLQESTPTGSDSGSPTAMATTAKLDAVINEN